MILVKILGLFGLFKLILWLYGYLRGLFFLKKVGLSHRYGANSWAVVSGASDGIGLEYCRRLVKEGFNIVMISRDLEKLEQKKEELKLLNGNIQILVIAKDFTGSDKAVFFKDIGEKLKGLDISIVINNVGLSIEKDFYELETKEIKDMFAVNVLAHFGLTKLLVPQLQKRQHRGVLVEVISVGSLLAIPKFQVYIASKALLHSMVDGQSFYLPDSKVDVLHVQPGLVSTNMSHRKPGENIAVDYVQTREAHADGVFLALGNSVHTFGAFYHRLLWPLLSAIFELVPRDWLYHWGKAAEL